MRGLVHEAALGDREDGHALRGSRRRWQASFLPPLAPAVAAPPVPAEAEAPAVIATASRLRAELEVAARELVEGALVLEEDDLAVGLPAELQADGHLGHLHVADDLALLVDAAGAVGAADADAALADRGEDGVPVALLRRTGRSAPASRNTLIVSASVAARAAAGRKAARASRQAAARTVRNLGFMESPLSSRGYFRSDFRDTK